MKTENMGTLFSSGSLFKFEIEGNVIKTSTTFRHADSIFIVISATFAPLLFEYSIVFLM